MMIMVIMVVWGLGPVGLGWVGFGSMKWTTDNSDVLYSSI